MSWDKDRIDEAVALVLKYGSIDGAHHKAWVLDQVLRTLLTERDYQEVIRTREDAGGEWDIGIAP